MGSSCMLHCSGVHTLHIRRNNLNLVCLIPARIWSFSLHSIYQWCVLKQVPQGGATIYWFSLKMDAQLRSLGQNKLKTWHRYGKNCLDDSCLQCLLLGTGDLLHWQSVKVQ